MTAKLVYLPRRAASVSRADWPKTWKSHAIFASQFPVLEARLDFLLYCNRLDASEVPGLSTAYDGVAVAGSPDPRSFDGSGLSEEARARINADELRVFAEYTPNFSFYCAETLALDGPHGDAAVIRFLARKENLSREAFEEQFLKSHAARAAALAGNQQGLTRMALNRLVKPPPAGYAVDGIHECWYASEADARRSLAHAGGSAIAEDLAAFSAMDRSITMLVAPFHRWPKG